MLTKYNWAILGPGRIARKFANDLRLLPNASLCAVGSNSIERATAFANDFGIRRAYGSYKELVSDPDVDIVYIGTLHTGHYSDTLLCLEHGKHVLCEKPVAMNLRQFEHMAAVAVKNGVFFMEALWTRFTPSFIKCIDIITSGAIGEIRCIHADFCINPPYSDDSRLFNPELGGGSLLDIGIYPVFIALELGSDVVSIKAHASLDQNSIDRICTVLMSHHKGEQSILYSASQTNGRIEALIQGSKGMLRLNKCWHTPTSLDLFPDGKEMIHYTFDMQGSGYQYEAVDVMRCLDENLSESPLWPLAKSRRLISTLDAIREQTGIQYPEHLEAIQQA